MESVQDQAPSIPADRVERLAAFLRRKVSNFEEVQNGVRDDWGQDSVKVIFHRENFSNFLLGETNAIKPITAEIWPSLSCDARCPLCTYSINNARTADDRTDHITLADTERYLALINDLHQSGVKSLILTGGGEPLLNHNIGQILERISALDLKWGMFTHGLHLDGKNADAILENPPKFLRVSLNSSSAESHQAEYRLGLSAYHSILSNLANFAKRAADAGVSVGVGFAVDPKTLDDDFRKIGMCLEDLFLRSEGNLKYASFRPKVVYYNRDGEPRFNQVRQEQFRDLPDRIKQHVLPHLENAQAAGFRLDIKHHQFSNISGQRVFASALGMSWVTQFDHNATGYILSELNGSPWSDASYGEFEVNQGFEELWMGKKRLSLAERYQSGILKVPLNLKTAHVDFLLETIRSQFGILDQKEVDRLWALDPIASMPKPKNWDFL